MSLSRVEFLNLGIIEIVGQITLCCGRCPMNYRMFSIIPGLYPQDAPNTAPIMTIKKTSDIAMSLENH